MITSKADQERNCRKSAYEILLMRSWKNEEQREIDPSTMGYEHLLNSFEGINFTNESTGQIFNALKKHICAACARLKKRVRDDAFKHELEELINETEKAQDLSEVDDIVEKALNATQALVR